VLPQNLQFTLVGASSNVHHLVMAKHDGSYYVAFWLEEQDYDVNKRSETLVSPEKLTFVASRVFKKIQLLAFSADGSLKATQLNPSERISLTATDCIAILKTPVNLLSKRAWRRYKSINFGAAAPLELPVK
jgi:hypothetical protein